MLSTTTHLTTDIVAMPLLWVLPLGLYLLSFVVAFSARRLATGVITALVPLFMLVAAAASFSRGAQNPLYAATFELLLLFCVSVALHGEMYRQRPPATQLTHFYLAMAVGGMVGGIFCAIIAPTIFDWVWEHPLLVLAAAVLVPQQAMLRLIGRIWQGPARGWLMFAVPVLALLLSWLVGSQVGPLSGVWGIAGGILIILLALVSIGRPAVFASCVLALMLCYGGWKMVGDSVFHHNRTRSYFGVYTIEDYPPPAPFRTLTHGTTLHGVQSGAPRLLHHPTTYYAPRSGVGLAMHEAGFMYGNHARIGVVGLGTGTLSCYAKPGQDWRFFEIDPAVTVIASRSFTFLRDCAPQARVELGDARLSLARQPPASLDLLALDAFSSDAVPMHLLTREAFQVYGRVLQPNGLLLVHVSNRYLDLKPVIVASARAGRWHAAILDHVPTGEEVTQHASRSIWIALSRNPFKVTELSLASMGQGEWIMLGSRNDFAGWSDDSASILPLLRINAFLPGFD